MSAIPEELEVQILKWILTIKTSSDDENEKRHRARIVSASHRSALRHSVHGNAPTLMLSTIRMLASILPTWQTISSTEKIVVLCRDTTKDFIQSHESKRLIIYQPPPEFFAAYPQYANHLWRAVIQIYGEVEAGLY